MVSRRPPADVEGVKARRAASPGTDGVVSPSRPYAGGRYARVGVAEFTAQSRVGRAVEDGRFRGSVISTLVCNVMPRLQPRPIPPYRAHLCLPVCGS